MRIFAAFSPKVNLISYLYTSMKAELHIRQFSDNKQERWARIGEQVTGRVVYLYIVAIRHYAPNTFSALLHFWKKRILANTICEGETAHL